LENNMTKLLRSLVCALPLLAVGAAHAQKASADTGTVWTRINLTVSQGNAVPVVTVSQSATKPLFLRQTHTNMPTVSSNAFTNCYLTSGLPIYVGGPGPDTGVPLMSGAQTSLNIPYQPGESVYIYCGAGGTWSFVFSN